MKKCLYICLCIYLIGEKMEEVKNVYIKSINKRATLNIVVDNNNVFEGASAKIIVEVQLAVNDKIVKFEESDKLFDLCNKSIEEINSDMNNKLDEIIQYTREKAKRLENIIHFMNEYCKAKEINFEINIL